MSTKKVFLYLAKRNIDHVHKVLHCEHIVSDKQNLQCVCGAMCRYQDLVWIDKKIFLLVASTCLKYIKDEEKKSTAGNRGLDSICEAEPPTFCPIDEEAYSKKCEFYGTQYLLKKADAANRKEEKFKVGLNSQASAPTPVERDSSRNRREEDESQSNLLFRILGYSTLPVNDPTIGQTRILKAISEFCDIPPDFDIDRFKYGPISGINRERRLISAFTWKLLPLKDGVLSYPPIICSDCGGEHDDFDCRNCF